MRALQKSIILSGFTGCGKSTVGRIVARRLGAAFVDTDARFTEVFGMTAQEAFRQRGEACFRDMEREIAREVSGMPPCVIATGGGMLADNEIGAMLSGAGIVVFIDRPFDAIWGSLSATPDRPLLKGRDRDAVKSLWTARIPHYLRHARLRVENRSTPEACAETVLNFCAENAEM